jgi:ATP-dependent Lhr-like helicase
VGLRTGDSLPQQRQQLWQQPPDILVTTPESLFILLVSARGRKLLANVEQVVVDEVHALAANKRGTHLSLSLERLQTLLKKPLQRIGLSATQKPLSDLSSWLCGGRDCNILDATERREKQITLQLPAEPLAALLSQQQFSDICSQIHGLLGLHRVVLVFVNTRRMAERVGRALTELGEADQVAVYHGSLSRSARLQAEQALRAGDLRVVVATSALELGIDIGDIDCVAQLGSPKSIAALLQRAGRSGHSAGGVPKAQLFPLTRNDLLECSALLQCIQRNELDRLDLPALQWDVLVQHVIAECCCKPTTERALAAWIRRAWPYREISDAALAEMLQVLAAGYTRRNDQVRLSHDRQRKSVSASRQLRTLVAMNAGAIPEHFDQDVWLLPERKHLGTVDEEFAFESMAGDVVQLGNRSLQVVRSCAEGLFMQAADEHPPALPFWFGEGAGRSVELGLAMASLLQAADSAQAAHADIHSATSAHAQLTHYLAASKSVLGHLPHQQQMVLERFFDSTGNFHVVLHNVCGIRINRAWGLALRKRFCRQFNFELQANATDNGILLSLGPTHSFPLASIIGYLHSVSVRAVLLQALLDAPMFVHRWRWVCNTSLAVLRQINGKRVPPQVQRNQAEDLLALLFPDQLACLENIRGEREIPAHPLVQQALNDCLFEAMDIDGLEQTLCAIESGKVQVHCIESNAPSPLAEELVHCQPWAFLDDGEAEERRTRTVTTHRRTPAADVARRMGRLSNVALSAIRRSSWPDVRGPEDLYDLLCQSGLLRMAEAQQGAPAGISNPLASRWPAWFAALRRQWRADVLQDDQGRAQFWVADEWFERLTLLYPDWGMATIRAHQRKMVTLEPDGCKSQLLAELLLRRLQVLPMQSAMTLSEQLQVPQPDIDAALLAQEQAGALISLSTDSADTECWLLRHQAQALRKLSLRLD